MIDKVIKTENGTTTISQYAIDSLKRNGTYLPDVKNVIFNLKTEKRIVETAKDGTKTKKTVKLDKPILMTKICWADGTSTTVKNSKHDNVETVEVNLDENGAVIAADDTETKVASTVIVASDCAKEFGIMAAVTKRTCQKFDNDGNEVDAGGMGRIITDINGSAYDQNLDAAKAVVMKAKAKAVYAERKAKESAKPKVKKYSDRDIKQLIGPILEALALRVAKNPEVLDKIMGA